MKGKTRAQTLIDNVEEKVQLIAQRYRRARAALYALDPTGDWTSTFKVLEAADVRWVSESVAEAAGEVERPIPGGGRPEGLEADSRRTISWIWYVGTGLGESSDAWHDCGMYFLTF